MEDIELRKILQEYLFFNNMRLSHVSKMTKIPYSTIFKWVSGERRLNERNVEKVKNYLAGKYEIEAEQVVNHLIRSVNNEH